MKPQTLFHSAALAFACLLLFSTKITASSISGFVWNDLNTNGIQDAGEPGLDTVWVFLLDAGGNQLDGRLTDANGTYAFDNVAAGTYILRFANPGGVWQTLQDQGNNDDVDSDAGPLGHTAPFDIADGQALDFDAGFTTVPQGCFTPVSIDVSAVNCNDNATPDPADDTFTFDITATGGTGPWGWDMLPDLMMIPYGTPQTFGPFPVAGGAVTLTIHDHDNPDCTATVTVNPPAPCSHPGPPQGQEPCDIKEIACIKYELLGIELDLNKNRTYSIRVTNNCAAKMIYAAFQLPDGVTAKSPPDNSVYTSPGGREYDVRNPNFSPFYSIRFKSVTDSISNGESDIFAYTLPPQSDPAFIHVVTRLYPKIFYEAHLNTFGCVPVNVPKDAPAAQTNADGSDFSDDDDNQVQNPELRSAAQGELPALYPNPTSGELFADLSAWNGQKINLFVLNCRGQRVQANSAEADGAPFKIELNGELPDGLYFLEIVPGTGKRELQKFLLQR